MSIFLKVIKARKEVIKVRKTYGGKLYDMDTDEEIHQDELLKRLLQYPDIEIRKALLKEYGYQHLNPDGKVKSWYNQNLSQRIDHKTGAYYLKKGKGRTAITDVLR